MICYVVIEQEASESIDDAFDVPTVVAVRFDVEAAVRAGRAAATARVMRLGADHEATEWDDEPCVAGFMVTKDEGCTITHRYLVLECDDVVGR